MYPTLKRLYGFNLFTKEQLAQSVRVKWITREQYKEITGEEYNEPQA